MVAVQLQYLRVDRDGDREHHMLDSTLQKAKTLEALERFQNGRNPEFGTSQG